MRPMVSIIVPVYNAEQYLRRCVDSILNQEYTDFEVFLVNDGSTDSSGDICEEYGNKDTRVIVIQKENTGVSDSRNLALDRARGKYLQQKGRPQLAPARYGHGVPAVQPLRPPDRH